MAELLVTGKPDENGSVVKITPESAGWDYVAFEVFRLEADQTLEQQTGDQEVCLVLLSGRCHVSTDGDEFTSNYIIRHYSDFVDRSNLRKTATPFDRSRPRIIIVRSNDAKNRAVVEANRAVRIAESGHYVAYTIAR